MLQVREFDKDVDRLPQPTLWAAKRQGNRLDCETGILLRRALLPVFSTAQTWDALRRELQMRGFDLRFERGRLILIETMRGEKVCSCRYLGYPLASLVVRFGKLRARAPRAGMAFAQITS